MSTNSKPGPGARRFGTRSVRVVAGTVVTSLAVAGVALTGGHGAGAAAAPQAQSVGNFLDANLGNQPLDPVAKLKYATAVAPGSQSVQNPLDVTALNAVNLPLTGALQLQSLLGVTLGAANQVAVAHTDGYSYGASGAVNNSGGVSIGGNNAAFPANATIDLTPAGLAANSPIPIPGGVGTAAPLGGVKASIGAVSALAQTPVGVNKGSSTNYNIADLNLQIGSPLVGGLLQTVTGTLASVVSGLTGGLAAGLPGVSLPTDCFLATGKLPNLSLEGGAITIAATDGTITINLVKLLQQLGLDLNALPANTDLIDLLLNYLTSPSGLAQGLQNAVNGLVDPLVAEFNKCSAAINAIPLVGPILTGLINILTTGKTTLQTTVSGIVGGLGAVGGVSPLAPLGNVLKQLVDIGINVQPNNPSKNAQFPFKTMLAATPKQGTPVVAGQTIVRAIEIHLVGDPLATIALANAAAGPSAAAPTVVSSSPGAPASGSTTPGAPNTNIPTGVPAGQASGNQVPTLPLVLFAIGLIMAAGGAVAWKVRGTHAL